MRAFGLILADIWTGDDEGVAPPHTKLQSPVLGPGHKILHREMIGHCLENYLKTSGKYQKLS